MDNTNKKRHIMKMLEDADDDLITWLSRILNHQKILCPICGKPKVMKSFFSTPKSSGTYKSWLPVCKTCTSSLFMKYQAKYGNPYTAAEKLCSIFDIYYDGRLFKSCLDGNVIRDHWWSYTDDKKIFGKYLQKLNLKQTKRKRSFDNSYRKG